MCTVANQLLFNLCVVAGFGQYVWDYSVNPVYSDTTRWSSNGGPSYGSNGVNFSGSGGSLISIPAISGVNSSNYEVTSTLTITGGGGTYIHFFWTSGGTVQAGSGSYVSAEIVIPGGFTSPGNATLNINQCVSGTVTNLSSSSITATNGMTFRTVLVGHVLDIYGSNNELIGGIGIATLSTGNPGIGGYGIPAGSGFQSIKLGHQDTVAPYPVSPTSIATSVSSNSVSLKWQGVLDDPNGIGLYGYRVWRSGISLGFTLTPEFTDPTAQPSTTYTYSIRSVDFHINKTAFTNITVTTPGPGAVDPRRTGVYSTGSYWGGGGEQMDTLSGNLNFSVPLLKAQGRTGWTVPVGLVYNSQNWRQDSGVNWMLGSDVGYGFGWQMLIGSITPYIEGQDWTIDHYVYTDSTGAQYRLDQNNNGVWSGTNAVYVWFDSNADKLHFRDGSFWVMGSTSGGTEADAGTMYPTLIEDVNGNQVLINYQAGAGLAPTQINSSARINIIEDLRAFGCSSYVPNVASCATYTFVYNTDVPVPHLTSITNKISTSENYSFSYSSAPLGPPFGADPLWAGMTTTHLTAVAAVSANPYQFAYDTAGAGELTQATFPFGGHLRWNYVSDPYNGSRYLRAIGTRYLAADSAGANEWTYAITRDNASSATLHAWTSLVDASGTGSKTWNFITSAPAWQLGLLSKLLQKPSLSSAAILQDDTYTWSQEPVSGNLYISEKTTVMDEGSANQQAVLRTQLIDPYGNVTQSVTYPYNNTTSPLQIYSNTYLNLPVYTANYIFNRLATTTLTTGGTLKTLVANTYDQQGYVPPSYVNYQTFGYGYQLYTYGAHELDATPPIAPWGARGNLVSTTTPAHTAWLALYDYGGVAGSASTDGPAVTANTTSDTNYAAPQNIATETYSQALTYNTWLGVTQTTGANGETMTTTYDSLGRPATAKNGWASGNTTYPATYTYTYSAQNVVPAWQQKAGIDGVTITTLDGLGRPIRVSRGDSNGAQSWTDTVYAPCACSPLGKVQQVSQPYAPGGSPSWTVYSYDGIGRPLSVVQPDGASTTTYSYSGNLSSISDPAGKWKMSTTDVLGNVTTVVEPNPALQPGAPTITTSYSYDWMNHVAQVTMTRGATTQVRSFIYNDVGLLTSSTNPENGTVTYFYNADNTLHYKQDAKGQQTVYLYDDYKRLREVQGYPSGQSNAEDLCQRVTYYWDSSILISGNYNNLWPVTGWNQNRIAEIAYGPVNSSGASCAGGSPATSYEELYNYFPSGQIWNKTLVLLRGGAPDNITTYLGQNEQLTYITADYGYDTQGRLTATSYPLATPFVQNGSSLGTVVFKQTYDSMGRPASLTDTNYSWNWAQGVQHDYAGRLASLQYIAGTTGGVPSYSTETMTYNATGQMISQNWSTPASLGPTGGLQYGYTAGQNNGQIAQATDTLSGETVSYQYDLLKRMISAASNPNNGSSPAAWTQNFQYDGFGNLTAKVLNGTTTPIPVNGLTNQLSNAGYDLNGNMISGAGATFTYDGSNRITSAAEVSGGAEYYAYAPDNKRIYKLMADGTEEWTFYGGYGEKLGVFNYNATAGLYPVRSTVSFAGRMIVDNGFPVFQDRLGTNRASGARFYPYGDEITSTANDREKFGTYTRDSYTGLDYAGARYYASSYGNFSSPDPSMDNVDYKNPVSWNAYSYTNGDPINSNDPNGLDTVGLPNPSPNVYNCSSDFIYTASLVGETINQFFNSNEGVLGMMSYFEQEGSGSSADQKVWAALDWTFENQWNLSTSDKNWFYGPGNAPSSLIATITTGSGRSQVFTSTGQLTTNFNTQLLNTLTGAENSSQCAGLEQAFDVAAGVITGAGNLKNGITPIPDPVPGALQFGSNGAVPTHSPYVTQGSLPPITDGHNTWTFFTDTYTPPVRRPRPPRPPGRGKRPL
jgi:RHS repeat-associated protein